MVGIYKITNLINNKVYIGQSKDIKARWHRHRMAAFNSNYPQYNCLIYKAIRKYGIDNFAFEVLELCEEKELNEKEEYYIAQYDSTNKGYNMITAIQYSENNHITASVAADIRYLLLSTKLSQAEIAREFGTSQMTVSSINLGRSWPSELYTYPIRQRKKDHFYIDCGIKVFPGSIRCPGCDNKHRAEKHQLPVSREELKHLIRTKSFVSIGKMFGVTDNAIRKWCDKLKLPRRAADIKHISDEEWLNI